MRITETENKNDAGWRVMTREQAIEAAKQFYPSVNIGNKADEQAFYTIGVWVRVQP